MRCEDCVHEKVCEGYSNCEEAGLCEPKRQHGEWIFSGVEHTSDNPIDSDSYYCSVCKRSISTTLTRPEDLFPFCHCGADMRKEGYKK